MTGRPADELEEALSLALGRYAEKAPAPALDLIEKVAIRHRRRRRARKSGTAAALALALGATAFTGWPGGAAVFPERTAAPPAARPQDEPVVPPYEKPVEATPIEQLWPGAVHRIPARLPDGTEIRPQAMIDERRVLVSVWGGFEQTRALYSYDLETGRTTKITDVVTPKKTKIFASGFAVGGGRAVWYTVSANGTSTIWTAPLEGGAAVKAVERIPEEISGDLTVSGDRIYWAGRSGVRTAPLAGGAAETVPGTGKERLVQWPWVGADKGGVTRREVRNLETGEKRSAVPRAKGARWECWISWCVSWGKGTVVNRDGSAALDFPGQPVDKTVLLDRFVVGVHGLGSRPRILVADLRTGRIGSIALVRSKGSIVYSDTKGGTASRLYTTEVAGEHVIVDLAAVG